jgi:hypothetical protein
VVEALRRNRSTHLATVFGVVLNCRAATALPALRQERPFYIDASATPVGSPNRSRSLASRPLTAMRLSFYGHKFSSRRRDHSRGRIMRAQRVWKPVGVDKRNAEIERLLLELASFNKRIEELEKLHPQSSTIEALKANALVLSRQIDEVRSSKATEELTGLLSK